MILTMTKTHYCYDLGNGNNNYSNDCKDVDDDVFEDKRNDCKGSIADDDNTDNDHDDNNGEDADNNHDDNNMMKMTKTILMMMNLRLWLVL